MNDIPIHDIQTRDDIVLLVDSFYQKVKSNLVIGHIFVEVANVNWEIHLPVMYSFWAGVLLGEQSYEGNPMLKHIALSKKTPMTEVEFSEWLLLFTRTVDELFSGDKASEAKIRSGNISRLMMYKIQTA